jgi:hypothetical protein
MDAAVARSLLRLGMAGLVPGLLSCTVHIDSRGAPPTELTAPETSWATIPPVSTAASQTATSLRISSDSERLRFHVEGNGLGGYYELFLNSDNDLATGQQTAPWTSTGADYMVENGRLYRFESNAWQDLGASSVSSTANGTALDVAVAKSALVGLAPFFEVGFKDIATTWSLKSALPASGALAPYPQTVGFVVDGSAREWAGVRALATASSQPASSLKATFNEDFLYFIVQGRGLGGYYGLYLNTDDDPSTGFSEGNGADYMVQNGRLYQSKGSGWDWNDLGTAGVQEAKNSSVLEIRVARDAVGALARAITVQVVDIRSADWRTQGSLPSGSFAELSLSRFSKGMIVPAYLGVSPRNSADPGYDASLIATWTILAEAASAFKNGSNPNYKDFWVVVSSSRSGPFNEGEGDEPWARAASLWDPIRANDGVIFGYVHTCVSPTMPLVEQYRPLREVEEEIVAWVKGYPGLGGIWLDEFYPRYEIANTAGTAFFPNGDQNAPADRSWYNNGVPSWGQQVNPTGGYYDQLTKWIRATYPNLRIVGNAGGWFWSNQKNYADLVDVTCSFEQTLEYAQANRANQALDWHGLDRDNTWTPQGQLALIHTNSSDLAGAIDQSIAKGYTHFFTTDRRLEDNPWGGIPPYFATEVSYVANHD